MKPNTPILIIGIESRPNLDGFVIHAVNPEKTARVAISITRYELQKNRLPSQFADLLWVKLEQGSISLQDYKKER